MSNGTVKWFNGQKGYGFIQPEEGGADVFVHISAVERAGLQTLREGQKIAYRDRARPQRQDRCSQPASALNYWYRARNTGSGESAPHFVL